MPKKSGLTLFKILKKDEQFKHIPILMLTGVEGIIEEQEAPMDLRPTFEKSMAELLDAIDEDREPSHSGLENLGTMALLDGAYLSAEQGSRVEIGVE